VQRYGATLKTARELPDFVMDIKPPQGVVLAADYQYNQVHELEGELQALRLVDLDREGLGQYKDQLQKLGISYQGSSSPNGANYAATTSGNYGSSGFNNASASYNSPGYNTSSGGFSNNSVGFLSNANISNILADIFAQVDRDGNGRLSVEEAEKLLLRLNSRLGRRYGENEVRAFFDTFDENRDGGISLQEFKAAFEKLL
jgi:hypothetical protein